MTSPISSVWVALSVVAAALLSGCATTPPAPVTERAPPTGRVLPKGVEAKLQPVLPRASTTKPELGAGVVVTPLGAAEGTLYTVKAGDTMFSIAKAHGVSVRDLVAWNNVEHPASIKVGQQLRLLPLPRGSIMATPAPVAAPEDGSIKTQPLAQRVPYSDEAYARMSKSAAVAEVKPATKPEVKAEVKPEVKPETKPEEPRADGEVDWSWPTEGKVIAGFSDGSNKGIVISGKRGQAVNASAGGRVIFSGTGIRGLGKLVVIRHNADYLSVYAHNDNLLVKEGQTVRKGQRIADMGNSDADQVKLHFEIRRQGKPVDPEKLLPGT